MINLMNEHDLSEIEIEREGTKIKLRKGANGFEFESRPPAGHAIKAQLPVSATGEPAEKAESEANRKDIKSPMVGTFYRAPSPESPPFVESGQTVEVGQVVCIVEAMKLMNEIKSEVKGKIVDIPVDNAQPVEFGQTLFVVEPL